MGEKGRRKGRLIETGVGKCERILSGCKGSKRRKSEVKRHNGKRVRG